MTEVVENAETETGVHGPETLTSDRSGMTRRNALRIAGAGALAMGIAGGHGLLAPDLSARGLADKNGVFTAASIAWADSIYDEVFPISPLILSPFVDPLPIPKALAPRTPTVGPAPSKAKQNSLTGANAQAHQIWPTDLTPALPAPIVHQIDVKWGQHNFTTSNVQPIDSNGRPAPAYSTTGVNLGTAPRKLPPSTIWAFNGQFPGPMINAEYGKPVLVRFNNQLDQNPLGLDGQDFGDPTGKFLTHLHNGHTAPESDGNPHYSMRFGPKAEGYSPGMWVDNLYLNYPAGNLESEKQSFFWFHDHTDGMTGANVYKGMVGLYPIYDPVNDNGNEATGYRLPGVRTNNANGTFDVAYDIPLALYDCRLDDGNTLHHDFHDAKYPAAGNPRNHPEWWGKTFFRHFPNHGFVGDVFTINGVAYPTLTVKRRRYRLRFLDASIARIYELKLMKSATGHKTAISLGLTGDTEMQGQYRLTDGVQCMQWTEVATDGGLLPKALKRDTFELWPAKRREMVVDFSKYQDGTPTKAGDIIYLTNVMQMPNGRIWSKSTRFSSAQTAAAAAKGTADPIPNAGAPSNTATTADSLASPQQFAARDAAAAQAASQPQAATAAGAQTSASPGVIAAKGGGSSNVYQVPMMKIVIDATPVADNSLDPFNADGSARALRPLPPLPADWKNLLADRKIFELQRGGSAGGETEWLINGVPFNADVVATSKPNDLGNTPLAQQKKGSFALWEIKNGGGGWVHPLHMHMEEHRVVMRNGVDVTVNPDPGHPDDQSREDLVALDPGESVIIYRGFRDFVGPYVAHCHNLAHEDHAMMFGWEIIP